MPLYRFHLDVPVPPRVVVERLRSAVRNRPTWRESFSFKWTQAPEADKPFIGIVRDDSFRVQRKIQGRNSFLPLVWGRLRSTPTGARVTVTMFPHPIVAIFMLVWLGIVGSTALEFLFWSSRFKESSVTGLFLCGMFIFGVALVIGGFFPEARKAQRIIRSAVLISLINAAQPTEPIPNRD